MEGKTTTLLAVTDVNVSVMADQTPITVAIAHLRTTEPYDEDTYIFLSS